MVAAASIPLLIVTVADAILVGLAPTENYSPSDSLMQLSLLLALSLLSPVLPLAAFFIAIVSIRQIARKQGTLKGQGLAWAAIALSSISLLFFICNTPGFLAA